MYRLLIAGAGDFGREIASWLDGCHGANTEWTLAGFLSDVPGTLDGFNVPEKILGTIVDYVPQASDRVVVAIGEPSPKMQVVTRLRERGAQFQQLIHRSAIVCRNSTLGQGIILAPLCYVGGEAHIADFVVLNVGAIVGHDARVGEGSTLSGHSELTGRVQVGNGVFLATHACVVPKINIGDHAYLGAGSVVIRDVPAHERVFGIPAKRVAEIGRISNSPSTES